MRASPIQHLAVFVSFTLSAWALSPPPRESETLPDTVAKKQPTLAELQDDAEFIVYGPILRLDLDATGGEKFTAVIRPERTWRGQPPKLLTIKGALYRIGWCGNEDPKSPFKFLAHYLVFLKKGHEEGSYIATVTKAVYLPYYRTSPLNSIFGEAPAEIPPEETETMELLEVLERATGDIAEADRLSSLLDKSRSERDRRKREAEAIAEQAQAYLTKARAELARARGQRNVATRKALLEKLQSRLPSENPTEDIRILKDEICAELSIAETYSSNGIKEFPPASTPPAP